jgi:carbon monoxide dehydrogenase subunit G
MATKLHRTITVPGTPEEVFAYIADFANAAEWDPGIVSSVRVGDGPVGVGSGFQLVARFAGRNLATSYELTEYDEPNCVVFVGGTSNFTSTDTITVTQAVDGVQIGYGAVFELHGLLRFAEPLLKGRFEKLADDAVAGLKRVLTR